MPTEDEAATSEPAPSPSSEDPNDLVATLLRQLAAGAEAAPAAEVAPPARVRFDALFAPVVPDPVLVHRDDIVGQIVEALGRNRPAPVVLVGRSGSGRTSLLPLVADRLQNGGAAPLIRNTEMVRINGERLLDGSPVQDLDRALSAAGPDRIVAIDDVDVMLHAGTPGIHPALWAELRGQVTDERRRLILLMHQESLSAIETHDPAFMEQIVTISVPELRGDALAAALDSMASELARTHHVEIPGAVVTEASAAEAGPSGQCNRASASTCSTWAISRLVGPQPGYVGSDQPDGWLTTKVLRRPECVVLLDEIEKAHPDVWNTFLQVFDAGRLTDGRGIAVDFSRTIIVMTSNLGMAEATKASIGFRPQSEAMGSVIDRTLRQSMPPELIGRIDEVIVFQPLDIPALVDIARREIQEFSTRLVSRGYVLTTPDDVVRFVAEHGLTSSSAELTRGRNIGNNQASSVSLCGTQNAKLSFVPPSQFDITETRFATVAVCGRGLETGLLDTRSLVRRRPRHQRAPRRCPSSRRPYFHVVHQRRQQTRTTPSRLANLPLSVRGRTRRHTLHRVDGHTTR